METPTHLNYKPIVTVENYDNHDGKYKESTDAKSLSIGIAQYDEDEISAKVFRFEHNNRWSRQSEELPFHRVIDLSTTILKSILLSANIPFPQSSLNVKIVNQDNLRKIIDYYKDDNNRSELLPKLQELQIILNYFMDEESKL